MNVSETCQIRNISIVDVDTPLIIPSFSSRGFPEVRDIYAQTRDFIVDVSLVSAYDLYYQFIGNDIYSSDLIFIDSGGYETQPIKATTNLDDLYVSKNTSLIKTWNPYLHKDVLDDLKPYSQFVFISYDDWRNPQPISQQIDSAMDFFERYPNVASNFLYKPETQNANYINVESLINDISKIASFSILGITEKELGDSLLERCQNLLRIRSALNEKALQIPIHILGCLDSSLIIAYFLCGADIFDGLAWLRYVFTQGMVFYRSTATLLQKQWNYAERDLSSFYSLQNLQELNSLSKAMSQFCQTRRVEEFAPWQKVMTDVLNLVRDAELEIKE